MTGHKASSIHICISVDFYIDTNQVNAASNIDKAACIAGGL